MKQTRGRLGSFNGGSVEALRGANGPNRSGEGEGELALLGSGRLTSSEVAQQLASILDDHAPTDLAATTTTTSSSSSSSSPSRPSSSSCGGGLQARPPSAAALGGANGPNRSGSSSAASTEAAASLSKAGAPGAPSHVSSAKKASSDAKKASQACAANVIAGVVAGSGKDVGGSGVSSPLLDVNGVVDPRVARFGPNGASWRLSHGTRPISANRHKTLGFNPDVGRHAPLLAPSVLRAGAGGGGGLPEEF
jgi:hypothetical protein